VGDWWSVNRTGYFVTAEPCRPENRDEIFTS
jgi:hypothetical protein